MEPIARRKPARKTSVALIQGVRKLHLYGGVLFAPAILFFAVTGLIQTLNLHKAQPQTGYRPPAILVRLGALHKDQTFALAHKAEDEGPGQPRAGLRRHAESAQTPRAPKPMGLGRILLKGFVAAAAVGLAATTLLGLYMAYRLGRNPWLVAGLLLAGIVIPLGLIVGLGA